HLHYSHHAFTPSIAADHFALVSRREVAQSRPYELYPPLPSLVGKAVERDDESLAGADAREVGGVDAGAHADVQRIGHRGEKLPRHDAFAGPRKVVDQTIARRAQGQKSGARLDLAGRAVSDLLAAC